MLTKGLFLDGDPLLQPQETYRHMLNGTILESPGAAVTERGNRVVAGLVPGSTPVGSVLLPDGRTLLFATGDGTSTLYSVKGGAARLLLSDETWAEGNKLNFNEHHPIQAESRVNSLEETVIYWTDGLNEPRTLNLDRIPEGEFDVRNLALFPVIGSVPLFALDSIQPSGGRLKAGTYQFTFAYVADDNTVTNYPYVTNPIYISDDKEPDNEIIDTSQGGQFPYSDFDGAPPGKATSKAIRFTLSDLDRNYVSVRVAILYHAGQESANELAAPEVKLLSDIPIVDDEFSFTYTGFENTTPASLDEVTVPRVAYRRARAIRQLDGVLYLGNLDGKEEIDYQKYANNIQLELVTDDIPASARGSQQDPLVLFDKKGFKRDEVYAIYLSFLMDDGSESRAFHIPGRPSVAPAGGNAQATLTVTGGTGSSNLPAGGEINVTQTVPSTPAPAVARLAITSGGGPLLLNGAPYTATVEAHFDGTFIQVPINLDLSAESIVSEIERAFRNKPGHDSKWETLAHLADKEIIFTSRRNSPLDNGKTPTASTTNTDTEVVFESNTSAGGTDGQQTLPNDTITVVSENLPRTVTITGLKEGDAKETVAMKIHTALSGVPHLTDRYTISRSGSKITFVARNPGTRYNGTITITSNSGNTYTENDLAGGRNEEDGFGQGISLLVTPNHVTTTAPVASNMTPVEVATAIELALSTDPWVDTRFTVSRVDAAVTLTDRQQQTTYNGQYFNFLFYPSNFSGVQGTGQVFSGGFPIGGADEMGVPEGTDVDDLPGLHNFHLYGMQGPNGMAFWENQNEIYPNAPTSEIWSVDENGEGFATGSTLAGQPVRHHHFPDSKASNPSFSDHPATGIRLTHHTVLGFRLTNIQIPKEIKGRIRGYKVYYASRGFGNRRILAQDAGMPVAYNYTPGETPTVRFLRKTMEQGATDTYDKFLSFHPFDLRVTKDNIGAVSYLKATSKWWEGERDEFYNVDLIRKVAGRAYIPFNRSEVTLDGFEEIEGLVADNDREEAKILVEIPSGLPVDDDESRVLDYVWDFVVHRMDLYSNYDNQILVSTGYLHTDLDNLDSEPIFGGDTVFGAYEFGVAESEIQDEYTGDISADNPTPDGEQDYKVDEATGEIRYFWEEQHRVQGGYFELMHNPWFRYNGDEAWQSKDAMYTAYREFTKRDSDVPESEKFDFWLGYNPVYSVLNSVGTTVPANPTVRLPESYPTRVIRSAKASDSLDIEGFRVFKDADFLDLPRNRGALRFLAVAGGLLVPHMERGFFRTKGREEVIVGDSRAFLGAGDIFAVQPSEIYATDEGYGGLQHTQTALLTQYGYFWVDQQARKVFLMSSGVDEVSSLGLETFFRDNLDFELTKYGFDQTLLPNLCTLLSTYDPQTGRIFLTKREKVPTETFKEQFDSNKIVSVGPIFMRQIYNPITQAPLYVPISYDNQTYFQDEGWTLSYMPRAKAWESFFSFIPEFYFSNLNHFYSVDDSTVYEYGTGVRGQFYGEQHPFEVEWVDNAGTGVDKQVAALAFDTTVLDGETEMLKETFDEIRIRNTYQDTGLVSVQNLKNARRTKRVWHINRFRDILSEDSSRLPEWATKKRMTDKYHRIFLRYKNEFGRKLSLFNSDLINRIARR